MSIDARPNHENVQPIFSFLAAQMPCHVKDLSHIPLQSVFSAKLQLSKRHIDTVVHLAELRVPLTPPSKSVPMETATGHGKKAKDTKKHK